MNTLPTIQDLARFVLTLLQLSEGNYYQITVNDDSTITFVCTPDYPIILPERIDNFFGEIEVLMPDITDTHISYTYSYSPITETIAPPA